MTVPQSPFTTPPQPGPVSAVPAVRAPAAPAVSAPAPPPSISMPTGGGAIRGIGEKFSANAVTGTASMSVPIALSKGRAGFGPVLALGYDSGRGNGVFGYGWAVNLPAVSRRTDKGLPRYDTGDTFVMSDAEDLVPVPSPVPAENYPNGYVIQCFRPRIEGLFARIERWTRADGDVHWRSITKDNVTTIYGADAESRIFDPADPTRVFSWLVSSSFDPVGNAVAHEYVAEDGVGVDISQAHERRRTGADRGTQRHLKRIRYGNRVSRLADPLLNDPQWMFEVVFDYGDHDPDTPLPAPDRAWSVREDPFSSYRSGFEVRTYRLCQRVLMFHHFPDEAGVGTDCLVRVTEFTYAADAAAGTFLTAVTSRGYARSGTGYVSRAMPPVEFTYSAARLNDNIVDVDPASLENLPSGLSTPGCRWVDLDGEGVAGMLLAATGGWYFKPNLGGARFGPAQPLPAVPSLAQTQVSLVDLAGDGQLDMVAFAGPTPGFAERTADGGWEPFRPFASLPALDWDDPNLRFADLDGDGHADVLITEDSALTWHASLAEDGFGPAVRVAAPRSEDNGPRLLFADGYGGTDAYAVHLADMSGDGLPDLVRIRNGEVCYWPNLGYGHFGHKVVMDLAPRLATDEIFDPRRVLLADVDGSGVTDLVYAGPRDVRLYRNRSGNGFTEATVLAATPDAGAHATELTVADLLGTGTACLVWSSSLPGQERRSLRYLDLYGGVKPHLLTGIANNLGSRTNVTYAPSTDFYLADKAAGRPWQTRLPFPVQVLTRVETQDLVAGNRFVTEYTYHHGFFDGVEREFRGFGLVEQRDTEQLPAIGGPLGDDVAASHVPPVLTRTWYHTGAFAGTADGLSARYATEYWPEDAQLRLPDTVWPPDAIAAEDLREACRALKGSLLRQEVYAEDGSDVQALPYSVTERSYGVDLLQSKGDNAHAVCFARPRETLSAHYERRRYDVEVNGQATRRTDPRVTHEVVLDVDEWGNVLRSATLAYGRRYPDADLDPLLDGGIRDAIRQAQTSPAASLTVSAYTNAVQTAADHRAPLPADVRTYELIHVTAPPGGPLSLDQVRSLADAAGDGAHDLPFEDVDAAGAVTAAPYRRLVEHNRVRYRRDDLAGALPPQTLAARGLVHESYQLAFTPGLLDVYQRSLDGGPPQDLLPQPAPVLAEGGYDYADGCWWIPSGQVRYSPGGADTPAQEFAHAVQHFFTPARHLDPFGAATVVTWDVYDLLVLDVRDPVGNRMSAGSRDPAAISDAEALTPTLDYRVLAPRMTSDANRNRSAVLYDALGHVTASAAMGKPEEQLGDVLDGLAADVSDAALAAYFADPLTSPQALLGGATARMLIDLHAFFRTRDDPQPAPVAVAVLTRETHRLAATRIQHRLSYSDGFGREIQVKTQAEAGPGGPRWVGSGWVVHNNKGEQVRRYEPFFTATPAFELAYAAGVSPVACFDPLGRPVAVLGPDGTYTKTVFDPWRHKTWDSNDTVLLDPRTDPDVAGFLAGFFATQPAGWQSWYQRRVTGGLGPREQQAAVEATVHAATPGTGYADTLGRTVVTVAHNRYATGGSATEERHAVRAVFDIEGAKRQTVDARGNTVLRTVFDAAGRAIATRSPDAGNHWYVPDVAGVPVRRWDSRGFDARHGFDAARRPTHLWITEPGGADPILAGLTVYGEQDPVAADDNVRGRSRFAFDGAGLLISQRHDFKGNLLASRRQLANVFDATPDWSALAGLPAAAVEAAAQPLLEPQPLAHASDYDALNRPTLQVLPDSTVVLPRYNEAGLLESLSARLAGSAGETPYVVDVDYDAHGRRVRVVHANDAVTEQQFDPLTFRLRRTVTTHGGHTLQDLSYVYDPVGNTVDLHDASQQTLFYDGQVTTPDTHYLLDALYRLIEATGREHASLGVQPDQNGPARQPLPHPNDPQAVRAYSQRYTYDPAGNILTMAHSAGPGSWTRTYTYATGSNRLLSHTVPGGPGSVAFAHDEHGNMVGMPHLGGVVAYDHHDQMMSAGLGGGGTAYYLYDGAGNRRRGVLVRPGGLVEERIYLPGYEIHRRRMNGQPVFERQTVHIGVERPVALVETTTVDVADPSQAGTRRTRFQLRDHVGSASIELDQDAALISREEYHPYGTTSMWLATSQVEASPKRYRYTGKERDDETGLYYHGARYYLPWLARWASYDPEGVRDGESLYMYVKGNPIRFSDPDGADCTEEYKVPIWGALAPGHAGYAVRPQLNPCLKDHPGWQQWQAEADRKASIAAGSGLRVGHGVALGAATAATAATAVVYFGGVALGSVGLSAAEKATLWALTNPAKMALAETMLQFGIGLIDPHPPGGSPMDMPGPADDFGRLARASMVREIGQVHSAEEVVKISVRFMKPRQLLEAIKATWALDKQALAHWRGQIFEGVLAATRYKFMEWVGRFKNGYFATIDFYGQRVGIQVKTLNAVPDVTKYKGFIDALAAAKKAGVMEDGRPLSSVALHIWVPKGFTGPQGLKAQYEAAIKAIKQYAAEKHIPISVIPMTEEQLNLVVQAPK